MSLRTATVASSDSDGRFAEYFASDGRRYFYDTWFNTVVWSKDNATKAAVKKQDKDPGQKTGQKTDDDDATLGAFPAPRPDDNPGIHGGAWYRDAETGEVIFETPPPPPDPGNVDNDGRPQPITEDSLYTQLVNIRGGLAWSAGFSWVCGPQQDTRCTRYCVDHETDSGGWILMARAHVMRVASKNSPGLRQREKDFLRRNETAPAGPFGSRQAEGGFRELARALGIRDDSPEAIKAVVRDVRVFACSSLAKSPVIHVKSTSKREISKCVVEGPMSIAKAALAHLAGEHEWRALFSRKCKALPHDSSLVESQRCCRSSSLCGLTHDVCCTNARDMLQFALVWVRLHPGAVYSGTENGDPSFMSVMDIGTPFLLESGGWHARFTSRKEQSASSVESDCIVSSQASHVDPNAIKLARAESADEATVMRMSRPDDVPAHLQSHFAREMSFEPCFLCRGTGERWVAVANSYGDDAGELARQESLSRSMESAASVGEEADERISEKDICLTGSLIDGNRYRLPSTSGSHSSSDESDSDRHSDGGGESKENIRGRPRRFGFKAKRRIKRATEMTRLSGKDKALQKTKRKKNQVVPLQRDRCWICRGTGNASQSIVSSIEDNDNGSGGEADAFMSHNTPHEEDLCSICWTNRPQYGIATTCTHLFCNQCIPMFLKSIKQSGDFPGYCPMCKDACPRGKVTRYGRITGKALGFLRSVGLIDLEFQVQFMRLQNGNDEDHYFKCPSPTCENILVDQDPVKVLRNGKQTTRSVEKCPCGVAVCLLCHSVATTGNHELVCPMQKKKSKKKGGKEKKKKTKKKTKTKTKTEEKDDGDSTDDSDGEDEFDVDIETKQMMKKLGKKCPNCSMFILKNEGCDTMFCGDKAHGDLRRAIKNGGCGQQFQWSTMKKISANIIGPNGERIHCDPPVKFATEIALLKKQYGILHTDKEEELIRAAKASGKNPLETAQEQARSGVRIRRLRSTASAVFECARDGNVFRLMRTIECARVRGAGRAQTQAQQNERQGGIWIQRLGGVPQWGVCCRARYEVFYMFLSWFPHGPTPLYFISVLLMILTDPLKLLFRGVVYVLSGGARGHPFDLTIFLVQVRSVLMLGVWLATLVLHAMYAGYFRFFSIPLAVGGYAAVLFASSRTFYDACDTPLRIACQRGHADVVRILLREGSSLTARVGESNLTPLRICTLYGRWDAANALYEFDEQMPHQAIDTGNYQGANRLGFTESLCGTFSPLVEAAVCCCRFEAACCLRLDGNRGGRCSDHRACRRLHLKSMKRLLNNLFLLFCIGFWALRSEFDTCMPVYVNTTGECTFFNNVIRVNEDSSYLPFDNEMMARPPLNSTWQGKCNRFLTCAMTRYGDVARCDKAKPGCECSRKVCRDRIYFDLRNASDPNTGMGDVDTSRDARFDIRVVLPTRAQAQAEMDASGVRGITLFDAPPDSDSSVRDLRSGTWLGLLRAKGRNETLVGTTTIVAESNDPSLIVFRMRSGSVGSSRDSFHTHPPVRAGRGPRIGGPGMACLDVDIGSHPEIFDGLLHNVSWTIRPRKNGRRLRIALYVDGLLITSSTSQGEQRKDQNDIFVQPWGSARGAVTVGYSNVSFFSLHYPAWSHEGWWNWWPGKDNVFPSFGSDVLMPNVRSFQECSAKSKNEMNCFHSTPPNMNIAAGCSPQGGVRELTCELKHSLFPDSVTVQLFRLRDYNGRCVNMVGPTKSAPHGCPISHFQKRSTTLVYTWNPVLVDPSSEEGAFSPRQRAPLISGPSPIFVNECDHSSLEADPQGDWTKDEAFLPVREGDSLVGRRGILPAREEDHAGNLTRQLIDAALWQWRDLPRCDFDDVRHTEETQCDATLRCGKDLIF
jgi:hypothetical protein